MKTLLVKRTLAIVIVVFLSSIICSAQKPLGNEWINYNQKYYSFKIAKTGIVRITYNALLNSGIPIQTTNPKNIQIYGRGIEEYIYISNENTGIFGPNDYIEFYAQKNDGWLDSRLYNNPNDQVHQKYSLFNDTATYFLTISNSINNKRITLDNSADFANYTPSSWYYCISEIYYSNEYLDGVPLISSSSNTMYDPEYNKAEGWYDYPFTLGTPISRNINTSFAYTGLGAPTAQINYTVFGASDYTSANPNHHLRIQFAGNIIDTLYNGYTLLNFEHQIAASSLGSTNTNFTFSSINDIGSGADRNALSFIKIKYPHLPNLGNQTQADVYMPSLSGGKSYFKFTNFNGGTTPIFYDLDNHVKHLVNVSSGEYSVLIPNSTNQKHCYITSSANVTTINILNPVGPGAKFVNVFAQKPNFDYIIISHSSLMGSQSANTADDYAAYRQSSGYKSLIVNVEQLYDQYAYGIYKNPIAIRNFLREANIKAMDSIRGTFLIGKAYRSIAIRKDPNLFNQSLVPVLGNPPSDLLFCSGFKYDSVYTPAFPIGRLSAKTVDDVDLYLSKIIDYEDRINNPAAIWMKDILHFSGGSNSWEQSQISGYLKNWENIIEDSLLGANVETIYKTTNDPIQINLSDYIRDKVNNGVSMMTFFGHAAGIGFDISIDNPSEYSNKGKYPFLLANSCYAGDIFQVTNQGSVNSSEAFVLIRDKGMIAYLASITPASMPYLNYYSTNFYENLAFREYNTTVGYNMKKAIENMQKSSDPINVRKQKKEICFEMILHGDPAIVLNSFDKPDYFINQQSISFVPSDITTAIDSFKVNVVISNQGKAVNDTMVVELNRLYSDGTLDSSMIYRMKATYYRDTISFTLPVNRVKGVGLNKIEIKIDSYSNIDELKESNNNIKVDLNIKAADLLPVFPSEFAIISTPNVKLLASTYYPFSAEKKYVFELDTNKYFNSPFKISTTIKSSGGVLEWAPTVSLIDSTVYFWRVSIDSTTNKGGYNWRSSSFQYISGLEGWEQANIFQFEKNRMQLLKIDEVQRKFNFANDFKLITAQTGVYPNIAWTEIWYRINNISYSIWTCMDNGMKFAVFNPTSGNPLWSVNQGNGLGSSGNVHCTWYDWPAFEFPTTTTTSSPALADSIWFRRTADFIAQIPNGYSVLVSSIKNHNAQNYPEYLYKAYDSLGSNYIRSLTNNRPFLLFGRKGDFGNAQEILGTSTQSIIDITDSVLTNWKEGFMESPKIGPSVNWKSLHWRIHSLEDPQLDSVRLTLYGIKHDGTEVVILSDLKPDVNADISQLNQIMDAQIYPYCRLISYLKDDSMRTPAQFDRWQIVYQSAPEIAIDPLTHFSFFSDTIQEGDTLKFAIGIRNISSENMDSVLVKYWLIDNKNKRHEIITKRISNILKNSFTTDSISFSTKGLEGNCFLWLEANPVNDSTGIYDQLEITHANNLGEKKFFVRKDRQNPIMDITFDGIHILDGDIISANPEIFISLNDENKYIPLEDTTRYKIYIKDPSNVEKRMYFTENGNENIKFIAGTLQSNRAKMYFNPKFTKDGNYSLRVQATDESLNQSGTRDYSISFRVINKSTITEVMNWPNPFTTKTHFVFTLTGSEIPTYFTIQIMTVSGKVVKEITLDELGPINIGRNITEYAWDGTDTYGDRLANGVYIYRVLTRIENNEIEKSSTDADKYFTKGFGKMYLIR